MTFIWLIAWWFSGTPQLEQWNDWTVFLIVCIVIDVTSGKSAL